MSKKSLKSQVPSNLLKLSNLLMKMNNKVLKLLRKTINTLAWASYLLNFQELLAITRRFLRINSNMTLTKGFRKFKLEQSILIS